MTDIDGGRQEEQRDREHDCHLDERLAALGNAVVTAANEAKPGPQAPPHLTIVRLSSEVTVMLGMANRTAEMGL